MKNLVKYYEYDFDLLSAKGWTKNILADHGGMV